MKKLTKLLTYIIAGLAAVAAVLACVFTSLDNRSNHSGYDAEVMYNLNDTISTSNMKFEVVSEADKTCKFVGLTASSYTAMTNTLSIPEYATINGQDYKVVEIDTAADMKTGIISASQADTTLRIYGSWITALIVPDTVRKINEGAFYGMASLQYLKTPFPATITSSYGTISQSDECENPWSIHKLFAKGYYSSSDATYQDGYRRLSAATDQKLSKLSQWYDKIQTALIYFEMPCELEKIEITFDQAKSGMSSLSLMNRTFCEIDSLKEVVLPNGLTSVGEYTFASCDKLESVSIPATLKTLATGMFSECSSLTEMAIPRVFDIPDDFFGGCTSLEKVILPTSVKTIGDKAFANCPNLNVWLYEEEDPADCYNDIECAVIFPQKLEKIGKYAFQGVSSIKKINVPNSVTSIGQAAFLDCANIEYMTLPCVGKTPGTCNETVEKDNPNNFGFIFGISGDTANFYRRSQNGVTYSFPKKLETVNINNETLIEAATLGNLCFIESSVLKCGVRTITINKDCAIEAGAMAGSNALVDVTIPYIGSSTNHSSFGLLFSYPTSNPNAVNNTGARSTSQRAGVFYIPTSLETVNVIKQATIETGSFNNCTTLKNVVIGNYTQVIQSDIFFNNTVLESISLPFVGEQRGEFDVWYWYWKDEYIRNMLTWAFSGTRSADHYEDNTIAYYESYRRYVPLTLKSVTITNDTEIDYRSFKNLTSIETLTISDEEGILQRIESGAAAGCSGIKTLNLPFIGYDYNSAGADGGTHRAAYIFGSQASTGYNANGFYVPEKLEAVHVAYVTRVPAYAFAGMKSVSNISFDTKVLSIGAHAFENCSELSDITYTSDTSFKNVEAYAFNNCRKLMYIDEFIPAYNKGSITLGAYALAQTSVRNVDFDKITSVGDYCFSGCLNLESVNVTQKTEYLGTGAFADCYYLTDVKLGEGKAAPYLFKNCVSLQAIDLSKVIVDKTIPEGMFSGCKKLMWGNGDPTAGIVLNDQIETIGAQAFKDCNSFTKFVLPPLTKTIGNEAFLGCTSLESITIPKETKSIGKNVFTEMIGHGFTIWVYIDEENWPWATGWNCLNPVKVLPGNDDSIYTFEFSETLKGYVITGFKPEIMPNALEGTLVLPTGHDSVSVKAVCRDLIKYQQGINRVVVPACYDAIGVGAFDNGGRVDVYFEDKTSAAPYGYNALDLALDTSIRWNSLTTCADLISAGLIIYGEDWKYGTSVATTNIPYVLSTSLKYNFDVISNKPVYSAGYAWEPDVLSITLPGIMITNDSIISIDNTVPVDVYSYVYKNNINAGTATVNASMIQSAYNDYLANQGIYKVYLTGSASPTFEVLKKELKVLWQTAYDDVTHTEIGDWTEVLDAKYNPTTPWHLSNCWTSSNVDGLVNLYTMTGTLRVTNPNAGDYWIYGTSGGADEDFYWSSSPRVYYQGRDVTSNFEFGVYLHLVVNKLDVELGWVGGTYNNGTNKYEYQYQAKDITPDAVAYIFDSATLTRGEALPHSKCDVVVNKKIEKVTKYPGDTNSAEAYLATSALQNYNLVNGVAQNNTAIECDYQVVNAKVKISINDNNYLIPYDGQSYSFSSWYDPSVIAASYYTVTGLAQGSVLSGELVSVPFGIYNAHAQTIYSTENGGIEWLTKQVTLGNGLVYNGTGTPNLDYLIGRYDSNGLYEVENDYYDVTLDVSVKINYNKFTVEYYVGSEKLDVKENSTLNGTSFLSATYHTDGISKPVTVVITNPGLSSSTYQIKYTYDGPGSGTNTPMQVLEIGDYQLSTQVSRENFNTLTQTLDLTVVRSDIEHKNLDKEYDGLDVDLSDFITKCDPIAIPTLTKCSSTKTPIAECIEPGIYYIHIVAPETNYFNAIDEYYKFEITKRVIHIYVDRMNYFDPLSAPNTGGYWDGNRYFIAVDSSTLDATTRSLYMLGTDNIYGVLWTSASQPGVYDTSVAGEWYWSPAWTVYDGVSPTNKANVYYTVQLHGTFEILKRVFTISHNGVDANYDGNFYSSTVNVTNPSVGYKIYYTTTEPSTSYDDLRKQYYDNLSSSQWRTTNYTFQAPGSYQVWWKVVMDNYMTEYGSDTIVIRYVPITYDAPADFQLDASSAYFLYYTGLPYQLELTNVDPGAAYIEYSLDGGSWSNVAPVITGTAGVTTNHVLRFKISYPNYETIESSYAFRITEDGLPSLDGYIYADVPGGGSIPYDKDASRSIDVHVTYPSLTNYQIYYRTAGKGDWVTTNPTFTNAGSYLVEYMVVASGYKTYKGSASFVITPLDITGVSVSNYADDYDGEAHTTTITGLDAYPGIKVYYTTNEDIAYLDQMISEGWSEDPIEFTNVGVYDLYVRFVYPNYNDKVLKATITIVKATVAFSFTDGIEIEYLGRPVTVKDLGITTCHDGNITPTYFDAVYSGGVYQIVGTTPIFAPQQLGTYYVALHYDETNNCYEDDIDFGFVIVPRKLTVEYEDKVEYTGAAQYPEPKVDSGTGDKLDLVWTCLETAAPTDIGVYHYKFEFATPQVNYVIVDPVNPAYPLYPYEFEITKIKLLIDFETSMDYDYDNQKVWYKDSGWEAFDCFNKLLTDHKYGATMQTSSYAKGQYVYNSLSSVVPDNRVIVSDVSLINVKTGDDVSQYYDIVYDIKVKIVFPTLTVEVQDRTIPFDGDAHGLEIKVPDTVRNLTYWYATEEDYANGIWLTHKLTYQNVGDYKIYFKITSPNYEDYIGYATLHIKKTTLIVDVNPCDEEYDAFEHYVTYGVNASNIPASSAIVRYYKVGGSYEQEELYDFYAHFNSSDQIFTDGLTAMIDAGEYYAVVYYPETGNYYASYSVAKVKVLQRGLYVILNTSYFEVCDYDGTKKGITLGPSSIVDESGLVYGHRIVGSTKNTVIQTISPNAGDYLGSTGFEFKYDSMYKTIVIKDANNNVVTTNYKPIVDDSQLEIIINKIALDVFEADDLTRKYNGKPANPLITTPSDGLITYTYYRVIDGIVDYVALSAEEASNVGSYYVICDIAEGTNYYAWAGAMVAAYVTIEEATAPVVFGCTTTTFNGTYQKFNQLDDKGNVISTKPNAYIINVFGEKQYVDVSIRYNGTLHDSVLKSGVYEIIASTSDTNYILSSNISMLEVLAIEYELVFKDVTDATDDVWAMQFNTSSTLAADKIEIKGDWIDGMQLYNSGKSGQAVVSTLVKSSGSYTLESDFVLDYSVWTSGEDVTASVKFVLNGDVTITSNAITYIAEDQNIKYTGDTYTAEQFITVLSPIKRNVSILYSTGSVDPFETVSPEFTEVGQYKINFSIIDSTGRYETVSDSFIVNIYAKDSYLNFKASLNKEYDGKEIDIAKVKSVISGEYNGSVDDLEFTFYNASSNVPLTSNPVDAGEYRVVITSLVDSGSGTKNYSTLYVERYFEITSKKIQVVIDEDWEIASSADLISTWSTGQLVDATNAGLGTANTLYYEASSIDTLERGTYKEQINAFYSNNSNTYSFVCDGYEFAFTWNVTADNRYDYLDPSKNLDVSYNYNVEVLFQLKVHYPYMQVEINDVVSDYTGTAIHAVDTTAVKVPAVPVNLHKYYATSKKMLDDVTSEVSIATLGAINPGTYTFYYRYICDNYEPFEGSYKIIINYDTRVVNITNPGKIYDGLRVGHLSSTNMNYIPDFTTSLGASGMADNYDPTKVTCTYYKKGYKTPLTYVQDAGTYTLTLKIPASTYYAETIIDNYEFVIERKAIYIDGTYTVGYIGKQIVCYDFNTSTSPFEMYFADGTHIPSTLNFVNLAIGTAGSSKQTYYGHKLGESNAVNLLTSPTIYNGTTDVTVNYMILLSRKNTANDTYAYEAIIDIQNGIMTVDPISNSCEYDQLDHGVGIRVYMPTDGYTIRYYELDGNGDPVYSDTPITKKHVGIYDIYMVVSCPNYADTTVMATLTIAQAQTKIVIPKMDKDYDGKPIVIPSNITSNNDEIQPSDYSYKFKKYDSATDSYMDMAVNDRPTDANKYQMIVTVTAPAGSNYTSCEAIKEFEIRGLDTTINWSSTQFIYNGQSQAPVASFATVDGDTVNLSYSITPSDTNLVNDPDHKSIGVYTITITGIQTVRNGLETTSTNYKFNDLQRSINFTIVPRKVTIKLNKFVTYDGNIFTFIESAAGFSTVNIVDGHTVESTLKTKFNMPGNYTDISQYEWVSPTGSPVIIDTNNSGEDVTFNYAISYDLYLNVNYSTLSLTVLGYDAPYDGLPHGISVTVNNVFGEGETLPVITYSTTPNGTYTTQNPFFINYTLNQKVYYRITCPGYTSINGAENPDGSCFALVNISKVDAGLRLENEYTVFDKYYDAMPIVNPNMVYADMETTQRNIAYTYYQLETDPTKSNYGMYSELSYNPFAAGEYKLVVKVDSSENYSNGEYSTTFVIRKRTITITLPSGMTQDTKDYNGYRWYKDITASNYLTMMSVAEGPLTSTGIVPGDVLTGRIQTMAADVGTYNDATDFEWMSGYSITRNGNNVAGNYIVTNDMYVDISKVKMTVESSSYDGMYDGNAHTISVEVKKPTSGALIYYTTTPADPTSYSLNEIFKTTTGIQVVYFKIIDPMGNYEDYLWQETITIQGVVNDGTVIGPTGDIFYGDIYVAPYYSGSSTGVQTVEYFEAADMGRVNPISKPTNAGSYVYVVHLESDGVHSAEDFYGTFTIKTLVIEVEWEDLEQYYTGDALTPTATITTLEDVDLPLTVELTVDEAVDVGTYDVSVSYSNNNYTLSNPTETFKISKRKITVPDIKPDMEFRYEFKIPVLDENGDPVLDENGDPTYYEFGDKIVITDVDGNIYVLDTDGTILEILNPDGTVKESDPKLPYKIVLDESTDADKDGEKKTLKVVLDDKKNNEWADVANKDDDQEFNYEIKEYIFPDEKDGTSVSATIEAETFVVTGEAIEPVPTVVLKKNGIVISTLTTEYYDVTYDNNIDITDDALLTITGKNNYNFTIEIPFKIVDAKADLIVLKSGSKQTFMRVTMETEGIKIIEDGSDERGEKVNEVGEKFLDVDNFYLGHIQQKTPISKLLNQIDIENSKLRVYDGKGNLVSEADYDSPVGTGYTIKYVRVEDDLSETVLDSVECIVYGDVDGDGNVTLADAAVINRMTTSNTSVKISYSMIEDGSIASDTQYSYFTLANYYAAITTRKAANEDGASEGNSVTLSMKTTILMFTRSKDKVDFNAEYEIIE